MKSIVWSTGILFCCVVGFAAEVKGPQISDVRQSIENKESQKAVEQLQLIHSTGRLKESDVSRVSGWLSLFLYDETVATYEKALELAGKTDPRAQEELQKALAKEPNNKILHQSYIVYLIDQGKVEEARTYILGMEKKYPYFRIFSIYLRFLTKATQKATPKEQKMCSTASLSAEEKDFCRFVFIKEHLGLKLKVDKKMIAEAQQIQFSEVLFLLWEMTSNMEYLKQYITKCQTLTDKEKRSARLFPGVCSKVTEVEPLLKTEDPEE